MSTRPVTREASGQGVAAVEKLARAPTRCVLLATAHQYYTKQLRHRSNYTSFSIWHTGAHAMFAKLRHNETLHKDDEERWAVP